MGYNEALEKYILATNSHQFENVKKLLHEKAIYNFTDKTCTELNEIQNYFENAWETIKDEKYYISNKNWIVITEKTAICLYKFHYEGYFNSEYVKGSGRATNVFVKEKNNDWKLLHEHLSSK